VLQELSDCLVHGRRASTFIDRVDSSGETLAGKDYQTGLAIRMNQTDRAARLLALLNSLRPKTGGGRAPAAFRMFRVSSPTEATPAPTGRSVPGFVVVEHDDVDDDEPTVLERLDGPDRSTLGLEITSITRRELVAMRGRDGDEDEYRMVTSREPVSASLGAGEFITTAREPVSEPVRLTGTCRQWAGTIGGVQLDSSSDVLVVALADVADGLELKIGSRVSFRREGSRAREVWEATAESEE
jgi:hypothetical protein